MQEEGKIEHPQPLIKWQELKISFQAADALDSCAKYYLQP